jgi:hypothetical protein
MLAVPSKEKVAGAALKDSVSGAVPPANSTSGFGEATSRATLSPRQIPVADSVALLFIAAQFAWPVRLLRISISLPPTEATMRPSRNSTVPKVSAGNLSRSGLAGLALTTPRAVSMERAMRPPVGTAGRKRPVAIRWTRIVGRTSRAVENTTSPRSAAIAERSTSTRSASRTGGASVSVHCESVTSVRIARKFGQTSIRGEPSMATRKPLHALISQAMRSRTIRVEAISGSAATISAMTITAVPIAQTPRRIKGDGISPRMLSFRQNRLTGVTPVVTTT